MPSAMHPLARASFLAFLGLFGRATAGFDDEPDRCAPLPPNGSCALDHARLAATVADAVMFPDLRESKLKHALAAHLLRRPELGLVTCAPDEAAAAGASWQAQALRLRPLVEIPLPPPHALVKYLRVLSDPCTGDFACYVATQVAGPMLVRGAAWRDAGGALPAPNGTLAPAAALAARLWDRGWRVAVVDCDRATPLWRAAAGVPRGGAADAVFGRFARAPTVKPPAGSALEALFGRVEALNTRALEDRLAALYPVLASRAPRPPPPPAPPAPDEAGGGLTCV